MSEYMIKEETLTALADGVRAVSETEKELTTDEMIKQLNESAQILPNVLRSNAQELTEEQKNQARKNIGAVSETDAKAYSENKIDKPTVAKIGQILVVKAVDEDGKPTEFETVDKNKDVLTDESLSETSENPVQNKVITKAIGEKINKPSSGEIGQLLAVKDVDEDGKPIEFSCVIPSGGVSSWNDLTDKPFYDNSVVYFEITEGYEPIEQITTEDGVIFYKVMEDGLTLEQIVGSTGYARMNGNPHESVITEDDLVVNDGVISAADAFFSVTDACEVQGATLSTGTWIIYDPTFYIEKIEKVELKTIDSKFLPDELYAEIDTRIDAYIEEALGGEY